MRKCYLLVLGVISCSIRQWRLYAAWLVFIMAGPWALQMRVYWADYNHALTWAMGRIDVYIYLLILLPAIIEINNEQLSSCVGDRSSFSDT